MIRPAAILLVTLIILGGGLAAQDRSRAVSDDHLRDCRNLSVAQCAALFWIRERLRDCDVVTPAECAALIRQRERLEACAASTDGDGDCGPLPQQ